MDERKDPWSLFATGMSVALLCLLACGVIGWLTVHPDEPIPMIGRISGLPRIVVCAVPAIVTLGMAIIGGSTALPQWRRWRGLKQADALLAASGDRFSKHLGRKWIAAGWRPGRTVPDFAEAFGFPIHEAGRKFLTEFGGLKLDFNFFDADSVQEAMTYAKWIPHDAPPCAPLGLACNWSGDAPWAIWMTSDERIYLGDDQEFMLVGHTLREGLETITGITRRPRDYPIWTIHSPATDSRANS
ncbi:MAG: SUKH-3 domain-containing protein [Luteolibacter sp.]